MNPIYVGAAAILASGLAWTVGNIQGRAAAEIDCERQKVTDNVQALDNYRAAVEAQAAEDRANALQDRAQIDAAVAKLNKSAQRFEAIKANAVPPGDCNLSPEWVKAYDEAR